MKKLFYCWCALFAISVSAATRDVVPNADGEGSLGTPGKPWGYLYAVTGAVDEVVAGAITLDGDRRTSWLAGGSWWTNKPSTLLKIGRAHV